MLTEIITWKVNQPDKIQTLLRAYKHLSTIDEIFTILIRPNRIDFFSESSDGSSALVCTFTSSFFSEFHGFSTKILAVFSQLMVHVTEVNKPSIMSVLAKIRREDYLDMTVEYNSGVFASFAVPFTDKIHEICQTGGPELPLYPSWVSDRYVLWDEKMISLFPGAHTYFALKLTLQGLEIKLCEPGEENPASLPIKIGRKKIRVYEPQRQIEISRIPFNRLKTFIETSKKLKFHVQMSPEFSNINSQTVWQCFDEKKSVYFTLYLGCEGNVEGVKKEMEESEIMKFRKI